MTKHVYQIGDLVKIDNLYFVPCTRWVTDDDQYFDRILLKDQILEVIQLLDLTTDPAVRLWCPAKNITLTLYEYTLYDANAKSHR